MALQPSSNSVPSALKRRTPGNSLALRIPKLVARQLALEVDTPVGLSCEGDALMIRPLKGRLCLGDLLEQVSDANRHGEAQTGSPVGEEAW